MKNKIQKNIEKNHDQSSLTRLIKIGSLLLISLFVVFCTIISSFASSGSYELEGVYMMAVADQDLSSETGFSVLDEFHTPFYLEDYPNSPGDYLFTFADYYLESYPDGAFLVYSDDTTVLESIQSANSGDGTIYPGFYALNFYYLAGNPSITIPWSLIVKPSFVDIFLSVVSSIFTWFTSLVSVTVSFFYVNGALTPIGSISIISLGIGVVLLVLSIIHRYLRWG